MADTDLGDATIVFDTPEDGTVERTVQNEHLAYVQDHWIIKTEDDGDRDVVRRIPVHNVHYVERSVEEFEEEVSTLKRQVASVADDLRSRVFGDGESTPADEPHRIDVEDPDDR